jgi:hypothetical protein
MSGCTVILLLASYTAGSWISVVPKRITNDQECNVDIICIAQDLIAGRLDHFTVCDDDGAAIESFLLVS